MFSHGNHNNNPNPNNYTDQNTDLEADLFEEIKFNNLLKTINSKIGILFSYLYKSLSYLIYFMLFFFYECLFYLIYLSCHYLIYINY